jgi:hypothetical protein
VRQSRTQPKEGPRFLCVQILAGLSFTQFKVSTRKRLLQASNVYVRRLVCMCALSAVCMTLLPSIPIPRISISIKVLLASALSGRGSVALAPSRP